MPPLLTSDAPGLGSVFGAPQWGIFNQSGSPILTVDSVNDVEYTRDYQISDYPQEQGAFQSYNKVQQPFRAKVGFLINQSRFAFLNAVEAAVASLNLVSIITPEISYPSANLTHYGYRRTSRAGVTLILVEVWCEEIRIAGPPQLGTAQTTSNTPPPGPPQTTNGATPTQSGQVQGDPATQTTVSGGASSTGTATTITIDRYHGIELTPPT